MSEKYLHIVAFDIPYPPNYGGVIDVWYKLKALHAKGIKIILHCYEYPGRERSEKLANYCTWVFYYPRLVGLNSAFSLKPYIVSSRRSNELIKNLLKDDYPILFEGLHSCYYIDDKRIKNRFKIYRESNIEHRYYYSLFKVDKSLKKKLYFFIASIKLKLYQKVLKNASLMLVVSQRDTQYLKNHFPNNRIEYLPSFHANEQVESITGKGTYALYNGNIEVPENAHAVSYLMENVFNNINIPLVIAGMNPPAYIRQLADKHSNITVIPNPDDSEMFELIRDAHVNILVTFQATGLKLKLLNTLYQGRFCLVNSKMLNGTGLNELCVVGDTAHAQKVLLKDLFHREFKEPAIELRKEVLNKTYSNEHNAKKLIDLVFDN